MPMLLGQPTKALVGCSEMSGFMPSGMRHHCSVMDTHQTLSCLSSQQSLLVLILGRTVTLQSDNSTTVCCINRQKADIPAAMQLIRQLTLSCLQFQITVKAVHIKGICNFKSDLISRNKRRNGKISL